jgi:hypothetical protein
LSSGLPQEAKPSNALAANSAASAFAFFIMVLSAISRRVRPAMRIDAGETDIFR